MIVSRIAMSLRKPPTMTPARLAANRRNARFSTGPRTGQGKGRSRLNSLRHGERSAICREAWEVAFDAPPGRIDLTVAAYLTYQGANHPVFDEIVSFFEPSLPSSKGPRSRNKL